MAKRAAPYDVDLASLKKHLPKSLPVPPLLVEFGKFLQSSQRGSLGYFDLFGGDEISEHLLDDDEATAALRASVGVFLHLGEGSEVALWHHTADAPPAVVLLGSEGEHENVAPTLEAFLVALSERKTGISDLDEETEVPSRRGALAAWLTRRGIANAKGAKPPSFTSWLRTTLKSAEAKRKKVASKAPPVKRERPPVADAARAKEHARSLVERVQPLIGALSTDARLVALFADLGVDLGALKLDKERDVALPALGCEFRFDWPWEVNNTQLQKQYPRAMRDTLKRAKSPVLFAVHLHCNGYDTWVGREQVKFKAFPGPLWMGLTFTDDEKAVARKLGKAARHYDENFDLDDARTNRNLYVTVREKAPRRIETTCWKIRIEPY